MRHSFYPRGVLVCCCLVAVSLVCQHKVAAQNSTGALRGEVQDTSGARVSDARITVTSVNSNFSCEASASGNGGFRIDDLLPGTYRVTVQAANFAGAETTVQILVSTVRDVLVTLKPAGLRETISVQASASSVTTEPIDSASAVHQGTVTSRDLESLPLAARTFANIAYLIPGT